MAHFGYAQLDGLGSPTRRRHATFPDLAGGTPQIDANRGQAAKKTGPALADPGKYAGGKPATGRLCRTGPEFKGEGPELAHMPHLCDMVENAL